MNLLNMVLFFVLGLSINILHAIVSVVLSSIFLFTVLYCVQNMTMPTSMYLINGHILFDMINFMLSN